MYTHRLLQTWVSIMYWVFLMFLTISELNFFLINVQNYFQKIEFCEVHRKQNSFISCKRIVVWMFNHVARQQRLSGQWGGCNALLFPRSDQLVAILDLTVMQIVWSWVSSLQLRNWPFVNCFVVILVNFLDFVTLFPSFSSIFSHWLLIRTCDHTPCTRSLTGARMNLPRGVCRINFWEKKNGEKIWGWGGLPPQKQITFDPFVMWSEKTCHMSQRVKLQNKGY